MQGALTKIMGKLGMITVPNGHTSNPGEYSSILNFGNAI
jgi:hypothetical protein